MCSVEGKGNRIQKEGKDRVTRFSVGYYIHKVTQIREKQYHYFFAHIKLVLIQLMMVLALLKKKELK